MAGALLGGFGAASAGMPNIPKYVRPGVGGGNSMTPTSGPGMPGGQFKDGLPFVPFDEFPARLHKGERVLNAPEAEQYNLLEAEGEIPQPSRARLPVQSGVIPQNERIYDQRATMQPLASEPTAPNDGLLNATRPRRIGPSTSATDLAPEFFNESSAGTVMPSQASGVQNLRQPLQSFSMPMDENSPERKRITGAGVVNLTNEIGSPPLDASRRMTMNPATDGSIGQFKPELDADAVLGQRRLSTTPQTMQLNGQSPVNQRMQTFQNENVSSGGMPSRRIGADAVAPDSGFNAGMGIKRIGQPAARATTGDTSFAQLGAETQPFEQWHDEHLSSGDPAKADQALRDILGDAWDDVAPGKRQQVLTQVLNEDTSPHKNGAGFKERVIHGLKTAGLTFLMTGNPFLSAGAGVWGGVDTNVYHRIKHNAVDVPRATHDAGIENQQQQQNLNRATQYGNYSGVNRYTGRPTVAGQNAITARQNADRQERQFEATARRNAKTDARQDATLGLNRLNTFVRSMQPGTVIPKDVAEAAGIPALSGQPIRTNNTGEKTITDDVTGQIYTLKDGKITPVVEGSTGKPFSISPKPQPREPQYVDIGRARSSLKSKMGITDENALMPNPEHEAYFQTLKSENEAAVKDEGPESRLSDEALHARAAKKYPRTVRAGSLITPEMEREEAARMYQGSPSGRRPVTTPTKKKDTPRQVGDEVMHNKRRAKITAIHPDGTADVEYLQ